MIALVFFKFLIPTFSNSMHQLSPQKQYPSFMPRPPPPPPPPKKEKQSVNCPSLPFLDNPPIYLVFVSFPHEH